VDILSLEEKKALRLPDGGEGAERRGAAGGDAF